MAHTNNNKTLKKFIAIPFLTVAMLVWSGYIADAKIVVEGSRAFRDSVNDCFNEYRGTEGLIGDVIKELEKSGNNHKITEGPEWENSANNATKAKDGTGTGTQTKVSASELEKIKEKVPELANKDFCTALLHEMWHAVDADRGSWSDSKKDGVWEDEIEATMFQNFIHALRGVAMRTAYGGTDISESLGLAGGDLGQTPSPTPTPSSPALSPTPTDSSGAKVSSTMSFSHVAPGQYSEVYLDIIASPGASALAMLSGPAVEQPQAQGKIGSNGKLRLTWKIYQYGAYTVNGTVGDKPITGTVIVR
jgi:hypothetical protein